jgi:pimeloyl-ACP methyl ester carboxylesterase
LRRIAVSYPASGGIVDWSGDLDALLGQRGITRVSVLGSSLGGYLAQYFAATRPELVTDLFAANTLHSVSGVAERPPYSHDLWAAPIDDLRNGFAAAMQAQQPSRDEERHLIGLLLAEVAGRIPEMELRARLSALKTAPVLSEPVQSSEHCCVIESADDPLIPPVIQKGVRDRLAPAPVFRFLWGGHFPYVLRPDLYTGLLRGRLGLEAMPVEWDKGTA